MANAKDNPNFKLVANNKRARFEYEILEVFEAGIVLTGTEIKSIRANQVNLRQSFVQAKERELWLMDAHISEYKHGNRQNHKPKQPRKLLLHRKEINKIVDRLNQKGLTAVPTKMYLKKGLAKLEIGLGRGKKLHDKRSDIAKRDANRQMERSLNQKYE